MWFVARSVRGLVVLVDVEGCDQSKVLCWLPLDQVMKTLPLGWVDPGFPDRTDLDNHPCWCLDELSQSEEPLEDGTCFRLRSSCHSSDGAFSLQSSERVAMNAEGIDPGLSSFVS